jgi:hypothetical protein
LPALCDSVLRSASDTGSAGLGVLSGCVRIVQDDRAHRDCAMLCAMALTFFLKSSPGTPAHRAALVVATLYQDAAFQSPSFPGESIFLCIKQQISTHNSPRLQLAIARAVMSTFESSILFKPLAQEAAVQAQPTCLSLNLVLPVFLQQCLSQEDQGLRFIAYQGLVGWANALGQHLSTLEEQAGSSQYYFGVWYLFMSLISLDIPTRKHLPLFLMSSCFPSTYRPRLYSFRSTNRFGIEFHDGSSVE